MSTRIISPVVVGRAHELARLVEIARDPPGLALVEGEAGVGKTRLVRELLGQPALRSHQRLIGQCYSLGSPFPLAPVLEALRTAAVPSGARLDPVVGVLGPMLPELAGRLPAPPDPLPDVAASRHRTLRAIRELLRGLGWTVCVLEDMHWADESTLDMLRVLVTDFPDRLTLVVTYRREDLSPGGPLLDIIGGLPAGLADVRITLEPLAPGEVRSLVEGIFEVGDVSEEFARDLSEITDGIPLVVEEVLRLLHERDEDEDRVSFWRRPLPRGLGVPKGISDSIAGRVGRLSEAARLVVQAAAVLQEPVPAETVLEVAGLGRARGSLR